jgi:two-component system, NarL family, sensor kinase
MAVAQSPKSSSRVAPRVAWTLWGVTTAVVALGMVLVVLTRSVPNSGYATWYLWLLFMLGYLSFPTVGLIIAVRRPANPLGWLLLGMGLTLGLNDGMHAYGNYALVYKPGALPAGLAIGWVSTWNWAFIFPLFRFCSCYFPTVAYRRAVGARLPG